jgi:hypothetical protein
MPDSATVNSSASVASFLMKPRISEVQEDDMTRHRALSTLIGAALMVAGLARPALAGPPLVCFPFEIGTAASLPWNTSTTSYRGMLPTYDLTRLSGDTIALLIPSTPVIARMETLRRAALYASANQATARALLNTLLARAKASTTTADASLAEFDFGYLIETYRQLAPIAPFAATLVKDLDGYGMVRRSLDTRQGDPAMAFAAALITSGDKGLHADHVRMAKAGTSTDMLLARNIDHVGK